MIERGRRTGKDSYFAIANLHRHYALSPKVKYGVVRPLGSRWIEGGKIQWALGGRVVIEAKHSKKKVGLV